MTDTYIGWDGKTYPWPPPEGWYLASDGRYWAPNTGPGPASAAPQASALPPTAVQQPAPAQVPVQPAAQPASTGHTAQMPTYATDGHASTTPGAGPPPMGYAGGDQYAGQPPTAPSRGGGGRWLLAALGALVALAIAGAAFIFLTNRDGDDSATTGDTSSSTTTTEDTTGDTAGSDTTETTAGTTEPTETPATETSETTEAPTTTSESTTTTANEANQVAQFRQILSENGLTSDGISDNDIATFGTTFCIFAVASETNADYMEFREGAIASIDSELSDEELFVVIDAAVNVFCPEEAARLGVTVGG